MQILLVITENVKTYFLFQGLGKLAEKFPLFAKQSVDCLREFLTNPSKILTRLHRHYQQEKEKSPPQVMVTQSDRFAILIKNLFYALHFPPKGSCSFLRLSVKKQIFISVIKFSQP